MEKTVKQRLVEFIAALNITQAEFQRRCNLSSGYINNMVNGIGAAKLDQILSEFPILNAKWLLTGEGEMLKEQIKQEVTGNNNTSIAGNSNNVNSSSALERAIDEIAEMRKLLQEQVKINKEQFDKFISIIEKLS